MLMEELFYLSAVEALRLFRSRQLSPVELMKAVIARADLVEPQVNAFTERMFEDALAQAREAEGRYAGREKPPRPLEGLPVAIKEEQPIVGRSLRRGSVHVNAVAEITHPLVERIISAGGVPHARTTRPEFSCAGFTHSELWGITRNPWNLDFSPGGSSGGSAAALAAGTATLATGSDIAGSIRIPASMCGIVGYKPPYGRVPVLPPWNLDHYCHDGPMARTVADCALLQNVIAGPHPTDVVSLRPAVNIPLQPDGIEGWRVALCIHLGDYPIDSEVVANTYAVSDALVQAGAVVEEVEFGWKRADIMRAAWVHFGALFGLSISNEVDERYERFMPYTRAFFSTALAALQETSYLEGLEIEAKLYAELGALLDRFEVLVCPTFSIPALVAGEDYVDTTLVVDGVQLTHYLEAALTPMFNIASRCPVLAVPSGRSSDGVPTGVQIVGRTYEDEKVFRVAAVLERVRPWFNDPAWRPPL
jgi:Asp-tRNA(Asn)/Glu-tRNA(Gln) amidotransferase A subunit family amidase